jgi:hypothetical protein
VDASTNLPAPIVALDLPNDAVAAPAGDSRASGIVAFAIPQRLTIDRAVAPAVVGMVPHRLTAGRFANHYVLSAVRTDD